MYRISVDHRPEKSILVSGFKKMRFRWRGADSGTGFVWADRRPLSRKKVCGFKNIRICVNTFETALFFLHKSAFRNSVQMKHSRIRVTTEEQRRRLCERERQNSSRFRLTKQQLCTCIRGVGGGGVLNKFLYGEAPPGGPASYPFIYHFSPKRNAFHIPSIDKWYSFHIPRNALSSK